MSYVWAWFKVRRMFLDSHKMFLSLELYAIKNSVMISVVHSRLHMPSIVYVYKKLLVSFIIDNGSDHLIGPLWVNSDLVVTGR